MARDPSNPSIVYAGTGEQEGIGYDIYYGAGVLKSIDHGQTWTQTCTVPSSTCPFIGPYNDVSPFGYFTLGGTRISYVAVNPSNAQMVLVGAETSEDGANRLAERIRQDSLEKTQGLVVRIDTAT